MNLLFQCLWQARRRAVLALTLTLSILIAACGQGDRAAQSPAISPVSEEVASPASDVSAETLTVVFLGDSLTAGYGLEPGDALPEQIESIWRAEGIAAEAINAGVSGDTTANALARFDWSVLAAEPDVLVVALGANDFLLGLPVDAARANLAAILERAKEAGISAVLVGLEPRGDAEPGSREAMFAAIYPELAAEYGVPYYPSLLERIEGDPSKLQSDGLHPTKEGVVIIAAPLAEFLKPVLAETTPR